MNIFVNATAADYGGLKTIVEQFLESLISKKNKNTYYIFVSNKDFDKYSTHKIIIVNVDKKSWLKRFYWDCIGLNKWSKQKGVSPDIYFSLQNTASFINVRKKVVYLHTPIPFVDYDWNIFSKEERKLWFYKHVYPLFIKLFDNSNTEYIVQTNWMKNRLIKSFKNRKVHVVKPNINVDSLFNVSSVNDVEMKVINKNTTFFYPAMDYVYKNHKILVEALVQLKHENYKDLENLNVLFTLNKDSWVYDYAVSQGVDKYISFLGRISYDQVKFLYDKSDFVLFPSYIETFGLPLIEAACYGKEIFCADEEYSKEVIAEYGKVTFLSAKDIHSWKVALTNLKYKPLNDEYVNQFNVDRVDSWAMVKKIIEI